MDVMSGYAIEEALDRGDQIEMRFENGWVRMVDDDAKGWLRPMLRAGHRGLMFVARVVAA